LEKKLFRPVTICKTETTINNENSYNLHGQEIISGQVLLHMMQKLISIFNPHMGIATKSNIINKIGKGQTEIIMPTANHLVMKIQGKSNTNGNKKSAITIVDNGLCESKSHVLAEKLDTLLKDDNGKLQDPGLYLEDVKGTFIGGFAFITRSNKWITCATDVLGVKSLWYSTENGFAVASEKKYLEMTGYYNIEKVDPRSTPSYDTEEGTLHTYSTYELKPSVEPATKQPDEIIEELYRLLGESVSRCLPPSRIGILFSGGVDSTLVSMLCKKYSKQDICCYVAGLENEIQAPDVQHARKIANELELPLKIIEVSLEETEEILKKIVPLIETTSVPMAGVALPTYIAGRAAKEDGINVLFTGSGADEMFGGYNRHKKATDLNSECLKDTLNIHLKDTYRDGLIASELELDLRSPFLNRHVAEYALGIPAALKLNEKGNKMILRQVAERAGIPAEFALRNKKAAQYGSKFDRAIEKLAKRTGYKNKTDYLKNMEKNYKPKLGVLFSSGKDSHFAMYKMKEAGYPIECLITVKSKNPDSYMFHTPNINMASLQSEAMGIPLLEQETAGEKEVELDDLKKAIEKAKKEYGTEGVVTGALYSTYQKERIEGICSELGMYVYSPLWHMDQEEEMHKLLEEKFHFLFSSIAAYGLNNKWLGKEITKNEIDELVKLNDKIGLNVAGEGGEFESFVLDCPLYSRRIEIKKSTVIDIDEYTARLNIEDAILVQKDRTQNE
jgi:asparagine synthase (glutamine-hydrolysing)